MNFGHFSATDGAAGSHWRQGPSLTRGKGREKERQTERCSTRQPAITSFQKLIETNTLENVTLLKPHFIQSVEILIYTHFSQMVSVTTNTPYFLPEEFLISLFFTSTLSSSFFSISGTLVNCKALFLSGKPETSFPAREPSGKESKP